MFRLTTLLFFLLVNCSLLSAQLRLPAIISSGMVLQQNDSVALWGWGSPSETISITTGWNNQEYKATVSNRAKWKILIKTPAAGGPFSILLKGSRTIELKDVMIGEVWVCSGQSNMEWSYWNGLKDIAEELPVSYNPNIRFFHIPKTTAESRQDDVQAEWTVCDSNSLKSFSAVGYFFGKKISREMNVPVGLINSSWGGTPAEVWTPAEVFDLDEVLRVSAARLQTFRWWPSHIGLCYNAMIDPITNFNIAGAIWYQGESNTGNNDTYHRLFTSMIGSWRRKWNKDFPFYYVQIAPYRYGNKNVGALIQEAQTQTLSYPNTGMVVVTDIIDSVTNIHPSNKHEVGSRLANWALAETYHQKGITYKSPMYKEKMIRGNRITITVENAPAGLEASGKITGFFISGSNQDWHEAEAGIEGNKITVWSNQVPNPVHVRYGFGNTLIGNVFSKEGLPLCPFRTDNWPVDQRPIN